MENAQRLWQIVSWSACPRRRCSRSEAAMIASSILLLRKPLAVDLARDTGSLLQNFVELRHSKRFDQVVPVAQGTASLIIGLFAETTHGNREDWLRQADFF